MLNPLTLLYSQAALTDAGPERFNDVCSGVKPERGEDGSSVCVIMC